LNDGETDAAGGGGSGEDGPESGDENDQKQQARNISVGIGKGDVA
jgi:hypothetical protein